MSEGRLAVVATPIGNLEDVTLRALRVLSEADGVLAEDTRRTRTLLSRHGITARLRSFHAHSPGGAVDRLVEELRSGARLALVTDAGMPAVSDPGMELVAAAVAAGIAVEVVPGPSAVTAAVAVSGLRTEAFRFVGFLPRSGARRERALDRMAGDRGATVLFEAPGRAARTLRDIAERVPDRPVALCRELTKLHEEVWRGTAAELAARAEEAAPRGEVTLVVGGTGDPHDEPEAASAEDADALARRLLDGGASPRDVARELARTTGLKRSEAYRRVLELAAARPRR
jgi:16S rRNA (cytidine1402-2'-O)-methyltransferase